jgi:tRNA threonylcarbamoyladenosine biosynthesis protein TsaB
MAAAQQARMDGAPVGIISALMDARMDEVYAATYAFGSALVPAEVPRVIAAPSLMSPDGVAEYISAHQPGTPNPTLCGNAHAIYGARWTQAAWSAAAWPTAPSARAMLHLVPALWAAGAATDAALAIPVYVRDQVALTTAQRAALKAV